MKVKMILPSLAEAKSPFWRPIKYSLFPPLGLATLAGYLDPDDEIEIIDQHVEPLYLNDKPDLVIIQVYITNAYRSYAIADHYRHKGSYVALGGLHVTSMPEEAASHADTIFCGPGEDIFPIFLKDFKAKKPFKRYYSSLRNLEDVPPLRRDLIKKTLYLVPNSIIASRGCPYSCDFCYKSSFFTGGKSYYTYKTDRILAEIDNMLGRHLYFLDDHLFANPKFADSLFEGMKGMNRLFQGAATVESILKGKTIQKAYEAGLRSLFIGFETLHKKNLSQSNKYQNLRVKYEQAINKLHQFGIKINGSFVFGFDMDDRDVFKNTVDWAVSNSITTATFHILTPYPGTRLFSEMRQQKRITSFNWDLYDTRHAVFSPAKITQSELEEGYQYAYKAFYNYKNIFKSAFLQDSTIQILTHLAYTIGWKKLEPLWKLIINTKSLSNMTRVLEFILKKSSIKNNELEVSEAIIGNQLEKLSA